MGDRYLPLSLGVLTLDRAMPVDLWNEHGILLLARGQPVTSHTQLRSLAAHRPMVRADDYLKHCREGGDPELIRSGTLVADLPAAPEAEPGGPVPMENAADAAAAWIRLQKVLSAVLRNPEGNDFAVRLDAVYRQVKGLAADRADESLFMLLQMMQDQSLGYSASHALLVAVLCELLGDETAQPGWSTHSLSHAALTMNMGMFSLHNQLALQRTPLEEAQREQIRKHPEESARMLRELGVTDSLWLELVREHHESPDGSGYPAGKRNLSREQRLLHMADLFVARISPRANRKPLLPLVALRDTYSSLIEGNKELGEMLVRRLGLYPPGSYVRLKNGDTAVVIRRGQKVSQPQAVAIVNGQGMPIALPVLRDTAHPAFAVLSVVPAESVKVRIDPARIMRRL